MSSCADCLQKFYAHDKKFKVKKLWNKKRMITICETCNDKREDMEYCCKFCDNTTKKSFKNIALHGNNTLRLCDMCLKKYNYLMMDVGEQLRTPKPCKNLMKFCGQYLIFVRNTGVHYLADYSDCKALPRYMFSEYAEWSMENNRF